MLYIKWGKGNFERLLIMRRGKECNLEYEFDGGGGAGEVGYAHFNPYFPLAAKISRIVGVKK